MQMLDRRAGSSYTKACYKRGRACAKEEMHRCFTARQVELLCWLTHKACGQQLFAQLLAQRSTQGHSDRKCPPAWCTSVRQLHLADVRVAMLHAHTLHGKRELIPGGIRRPRNAPCDMLQHD